MPRLLLHAVASSRIAVAAAATVIAAGNNAAGVLLGGGGGAGAGSGVVDKETRSPVLHSFIRETTEPHRSLIHEAGMAAGRRGAPRWRGAQRRCTGAGAVRRCRGGAPTLAAPPARRCQQHGRRLSSGCRGRVLRAWQQPLPAAREAAATTLPAPQQPAVSLSSSHDGLCRGHATTAAGVALTESHADASRVS